MPARAQPGMKAIYNGLLKTLVLAFLLSSVLASNAWAEKASNTADQDAANSFFWSVYKLKPIPERLAE